MSPHPGQPAPRAAHLLVLGALLASCAPAAPASPASPAPATLAEVLAPDPVWPEVAPALESLRSKPHSDVLIRLGEENTRCSLVTSLDARLLRCGEATLRAPTLAAMLRSVNAGDMHRAHALGGLFLQKAAVDALGNPRSTARKMSANGVRWQQGDSGLTIDFQVKERGQIEATYQGLDGPESFTAASPREAWRLAQERSAALELGLQQRRLAVLFEKNLELLLRNLSLDASTLEGIKVGESHKGQAPFKGLPPTARSSPMADVFAGHLKQWNVGSNSWPSANLLRTTTSAETLRDRVISVEHIAFFTGSSFADRTRLRELPCERLRGWVELRIGANLRPEQPREETPRPLCRWRMERGERAVEIVVSPEHISARLSVARSGKEEMLARAEKIRLAQRLKESCELCRQVKIGSERAQYKARVIRVDHNACTMTLQKNDPATPELFDVPCLLNHEPHDDEQYL